MDLQITSLGPFIGSKDFQLSKAFYTDPGFTESAISGKMSRFYVNEFSFYLQDYYAQDWNNNTMLFIEVKDVEECFKKLTHLELAAKYTAVFECFYNTQIIRSN